MTIQEEKFRRRISNEIVAFIICLCLSGITAFPLNAEIKLLNNFFTAHSIVPLTDWIWQVNNGMEWMHNNYPFMAYGTDWLAFSHLVIAVFFIGPLRDPIRNIWVIEAGRIACVMVLLLAFICGYLRSIPIWWQFIDCSFGIVGFILLTVIYLQIQGLAKINSTTNTKIN